MDVGKSIRLNPNNPRDQWVMSLVHEGERVLIEGAGSTTRRVSVRFANGKAGTSEDLKKGILYVTTWRLIHVVDGVPDLRLATEVDCFPHLPRANFRKVLFAGQVDCGNLMVESTRKVAETLARAYADFPNVQPHNLEPARWKRLKDDPNLGYCTACFTAQAEVPAVAPVCRTCMRPVVEDLGE